MNADLWKSATEIFERALDMLPRERAAFVDASTSGRDDLAAIVKGMLAEDESDSTLLDDGIESVAHLAFDEPSDALKPGDTVGDFEIISEIGSGGMGIVYAARDSKLGRIAALKLLSSSVNDGRSSDQLIAEAQAASALDHPNVATIYQVGEASDGRRFIAMARYDGETLRDRIRQGPLPPREAFDIARQIASGLAAAHSAGLIHRDVKPENIFLTQQGLAKLLDFGIATLTTADQSESNRGTVLYMSPEQVSRQFAGPASDVWSLGIVLFEMLTGRTPFAGSTPAEVMSAIQDASTIRLPVEIRKLPYAAVEAVRRSVEKNPQKRYRNAAEFLTALDKAARLWTRPRTIRILAAAAVVVIVGGWLGYQQLRSNGATPAPVALAVLPVAGDSSDKDAVALATTLSDEIAARVVGLRRMRLTRPADPAHVTPAPGLHLLRLSVQQNGQYPRISVSLEDAESHKILMSSNRILNRGELREIGRDFVIGTLDAIGRPASDRERAAIGRSFPANSQAYDAFLHGNELLAIRTPASVESAMVSFRRATQEDSMFAAAYARQAYAYTLLVDWGWKPSASFPGDPLTEALSLADRATRLDSTSADAWLARAYILVGKDPLHFTGAVEAFQYAIALDPYNAEAFHQYGQTLMALGRYTEALAAYRRVLDLEPDRAMTLVPMAAINRRLGKRLESLSYLDSAIAAFPQVAYARATRSLLRAQLGDIAGARNDAEAAAKIASSYRVPQLAALASARWSSGERSSALKALSDAEEIVAATPSPTEAFWICAAEVALGRSDRAKEYLRRASPRGAVLWFMFQAEEFESFLKDSEMAAIIREADPRKPIG
ncbi:MAG TPA: protein kinase [Gemmatimonadaceae bacterium]